MTKVRLVYLETSGNQSFVFGTNKLSEVVGASELLLRVGTTYVRDSVNEVFARRPDDLLAELAIGDPAASGVEVILATSGKAFLLVDESKAKGFVTAWSRRVATEAPGVDATAVFSEAFDMDVKGALPKAVSEVHQLFGRARLFRTSPSARFPRLPHVAECRTSGLPAAGFGTEGSKPIVLSAVSLAKRRVAGEPQTQRRLAAAAPNGDALLARDIGEIEKALEQEDALNWLAVVHADGNGLGELFMSLERYVDRIATTSPDWWPGGGANLNRAYLETYRRFSLELDEISRRALEEASATLKRAGRRGRQFLPLIPIVSGGDDLTVLVDGTQALQFTKAYVEAFWRMASGTSSKAPATASLLSAASADLGSDRLGMSAGVSIAKPHFPFSTSYALAEQLLRSAKLAKRMVNKAVCSLDFHVLYDSSASSLDTIRERLRTGGVNLTRKPFVLGAEGTPADPRWLEAHRWKLFEDAVEAMRLLPGGQAHRMRAALRELDRDALERENDLLRKRFARGFATKWPGELFEATPSNGGTATGVYSTLFLDALDAKELL